MLSRPQRRSPPVLTIPSPTLLRRIQASGPACRQARISLDQEASVLRHSSDMYGSLMFVVHAPLPAREGYVDWAPLEDVWVNAIAGGVQFRDVETRSSCTM
nr:hypothetical protein CFP56_13004 [Quercus suber]